MTSSPERAEDLLYALLRGDRPDPRSDDFPFSLTLGTVTSRCRTDRGVLLPDPAYPGTHWHCSERLAGLYRAAYITVHEALAASTSTRVMMHAATVARLRTILEDAGEQAIREDGEIYCHDDTPGPAPSLIEDFKRLERACLGDLADLGHRDDLVRVAVIAEGCVGSGLPHFSVMAHGIRLFLCGSGFHPVHRPGALARARALGLAAHRDAARLLAVHDGAEETDAQVIAEDRGGVVRRPRGSPQPPEAKPALTHVVVKSDLSHLPGKKKVDGLGYTAHSPLAQYGHLANKALPLVPTPDLQAFIARLDAKYPWYRTVTRILAADLGRGRFARFRNTLLHGAPGTAKSSYALDALRAAGLATTLYSAAGAADSSFGGTSRQWGTGRPDVPLLCVAQAGQANVGVVLDETDKVPPAHVGGQNGRFEEVVLPYLAGTASEILDPYLEAPVDLSPVSYIATANDLARVPGPLRDRFRVIEAPMPTVADLPVIVRTMMDEIAREQGLDPAWVEPLAQDELDLLSSQWRPGSLRGLRRMVEILVDGRPAGALN